MHLLECDGRYRIYVATGKTLRLPDVQCRRKDFPTDTPRLGYAADNLHTVSFHGNRTEIAYVKHIFQYNDFHSTTL